MSHIHNLLSLKDQILLIIQNDEDYYEDPLLSEIVTCYPTGKREEEIEPAARPEAEGETVVLDEEDFAFVILDEIEDSWYGKEYRVYLENNTDQPLYFTWDNVGVNGWNADPYWGLRLAAHTRAVDAVSFGKSELAENGLEIIEKGITEALPEFDSLMYAVVRRK